MSHRERERERERESQWLVKTMQESMKKKKINNNNSNEDSKKKERHIVTWSQEVCPWLCVTHFCYLLYILIFDSLFPFVIYITKRVFEFAGGWYTPWANWSSWNREVWIPFFVCVCTKEKGLFRFCLWSKALLIDEI